jgi:hypothetical protein
MRRGTAMRKRLLAVAVGAVVLLGAPGAGAAIPSTLTIHHNPATENLYGKVRSSNDECRVGRDVKIFRKTASGRSLQGQVTTNENGRWKFHAMAAHGRFFAVTERYDAMGAGVCGKDRSPVVDVM